MYVDLSTDNNKSETGKHPEDKPKYLQTDDVSEYHPNTHLTAVNSDRHTGIFRLLRLRQADSR